MNARTLAIGAAIAVSLAAGTWRDRVPPLPNLMLGGSHVLAVDFHVHTHPLSTTVLAPWDVVFEARRAALDAIAVVPHDHVWAAKLARWVSQRAGGPIVIVGEENSATQCDVLAVGIERAIPWGWPASRVVDDVHAQGGVAIAAHPVPGKWPGCDDAIAMFDGSEIVHPEAFASDAVAEGLRAFNGRGTMAAIGDTDFHLGPFGMARTYVFASERSAEAIVEAVRQHRTIVYDRGRIYGDQGLVALANEDGRLPRLAASVAPRRLGTLDGAVGIAGLLAAVFFMFR